MSSRKPKATRNRAKDVETPRPRPPQRPQQPRDADALNFLDKLASMAPVTRQDHVNAQNAVGQLSRALQRLEAFTTAQSKDKDKGKPGEPPKGKGEP